jgi:predicted RNase H-like HicB family nuclease
VSRPRAARRVKRPAAPPIQIIVEKHADGYVSYPLGLKGVIVGQGDSYDAALADVKSAIRFHVETFGPETLVTDDPAQAVFVAEAEVST